MNINSKKEPTEIIFDLNKDHDLLKLTEGETSDIYYMLIKENKLDQKGLFSNVKLFDDNYNIVK